MYLTIIICILAIFIMYAWVQAIEGNKQVVFHLAVCILCTLLAFKAGQENILPIKMSSNTKNLAELKSLNKERILFLEEKIKEYKASEALFDQKQKEETIVPSNTKNTHDLIPK